MKSYFLLQGRMLYRKFSDFGIPPILGFPLASCLFIVLSVYTYQKTEFAPYVLLLVCLSIQMQLSERKRTDFLRSMFGDVMQTKIRIVEHLIVSIPFVAFLVYKNAFLEVGILVAISVLMAFFRFGKQFHYTMPTPFSQKPFEFAVGFRNTILLLPIAYILTVIAIYSDNLNLGIFGMLMLLLVTMSYYFKPEHEFYVWNFSLSPKSFLWQKIKVGLSNACVLVSPIGIALVVFYPQDWNTILLFLGIGLVFLLAVILAKYAAYPDTITLIDAIVMAICIKFPPILLLFLPFYYFKSVRKLKLWLDDSN